MRVKKMYKRKEQLLFPPYLDEIIAKDNIVRLLDAFVEWLDTESVGFPIKHKNKHAPGAPQYAPKDLLKIYLYGYINRTRSSRQLAHCCKVNLEMIWLANGLAPGHVTIANFRKNNPKALKQVFRSYNHFLQGEDLFGKNTIAVDGAKIRAQNSKKNNFNEKVLKTRKAYIDKKTDEYLTFLKQNDEQENGLIAKKEIEEKIEQLGKRKKQYDVLQAQLDKAKEKGEKQISTTDTDARLLTVRGSKGTVGYNLQSAVDDKHNLIVYNEVTNQIDTNALHKIASEAKTELQVDKVNVLADRGYDTGEELKKCTEDNITTFVSPRVQNGGSKNKRFAKNKFKYDKQTDTYICPEGQILRTNNKVYSKLRKERKPATFKEYRLTFTICNNCIHKNICAGKRIDRKESRVIQRYLTADYTEANQQRIKENKNYYRRRQAIVEHPFGTIKRQWGYSYTLLKGIEKVGGEFNLICLCYNIRRSVSILGVEQLINQLKYRKTA